MATWFEKKLCLVAVFQDLTRKQTQFKNIFSPNQEEELRTSKINCYTWNKYIYGTLSSIGLLQIFINLFYLLAKI